MQPSHYTAGSPVFTSPPSSDDGISSSPPPSHSHPRLRDLMLVPLSTAWKNDRPLSLPAKLHSDTSAYTTLSPTPSTISTGTQRRYSLDIETNLSSVSPSPASSLASTGSKPWLNVEPPNPHPIKHTLRITAGTHHLPQMGEVVRDSRLVDSSIRQFAHGDGADTPVKLQGHVNSEKILGVIGEGKAEDEVVIDYDVYDVYNDIKDFHTSPPLIEGIEAEVDLPQGDLQSIPSKDQNEVVSHRHLAVNNGQQLHHSPQNAQYARPFEAGTITLPNGDQLRSFISNENPDLLITIVKTKEELEKECKPKLALPWNLSKGDGEKDTDGCDDDNPQSAGQRINSNGDYVITRVSLDNPKEFISWVVPKETMLRKLKLEGREVVEGQEESQDIELIVAETIEPDALRLPPKHWSLEFRRENPLHPRALLKTLKMLKPTRNWNDDDEEPRPLNRPLKSERTTSRSVQQAKSLLLKLQEAKAIEADVDLGHVPNTKMGSHWEPKLNKGKPSRLTDREIEVIKNREVTAAHTIAETEVSLLVPREKRLRPSRLGQSLTNVATGSGAVTLTATSTSASTSSSTSNRTTLPNWNLPVAAANPVSTAVPTVKFQGTPRGFKSTYVKRNGKFVKVFYKPKEA